MFDLKSLIKPRNGKAISAREYAAEIEVQESASAAAECEIEKLNAAERELILEYDTKGLDEIARKRSAQERIIQKAAIALPLLREHLAAACDAERQVRIEFHSAKNQATFEKLDKALTAACAANAEARAVYEAAAAELGGNDTALLIQPLHFGGLLMPDAVDVWRNFMRAALDPACQYRVVAKAPVPVAKSPSPKNGQDGTKTGLGSLQHAVRLRDEPQQQQRRPEPRAPLPDVPAPGMVRCRVEIAGYTDAGGVQLSKGALVDVKEGDARVAAQRGSITFVDGAPL